MSKVCMPCDNQLVEPVVETDTCPQCGESSWGEYCDSYTIVVEEENKPTLKSRKGGLK